MAKIGTFLGKLFGGEAARGEALLRAYGKLPFYAEYRRLEVAPGAPTVFSRWLDEGRLAWFQSPSKSANGSTRSTRLLCYPADPREALVASVWDSRDSIGRVFPFAFFVVCPADALGADPLERWAAAQAVCEDFARLYGELHRIGQGGDFYRLYQKRTVALRPADVEERVRRLRDEAAALSADAWYRGAGLDASTSPAEWFTGLLRRAQRLHAQADRAGELALSIPLSRAGAYGVQTAAWLLWIGGLVREAGRSPAMFVPTQDVEVPASCALLLRDLLPNDFQLLTTDEPAYEFVEHLGSIPQPGTDSGVVPRVVAPQGPLLDWLLPIAPARQADA